MALRQRVVGCDSVQEMDFARVDRYWDALSCAVDGRSFGACYLFGYAVEMCLKVAYFRFVGVPITDDLRGPLRAVRQNPQFPPRSNLHDILAWARLLIDERRARSRPLGINLEAELLNRATAVAREWAEWLRYRRAIPADTEAMAMHEHAEWFAGVQTRLWR